jgi:hypothetical protein
MVVISGLFREPMLMLEAAIVLLGFEFGGFFLYRFLKQDRTKSMTLAWALFFFCFSGATLIYMYNDFFTPSNTAIYVDIGYSIVGLGVIFFTFNAERELKQKFHILSLILLCAYAALIVNFFSPFTVAYYILIVSWTPFFLIMVIYLLKLMVKIKEYRFRVYGLSAGFLIYALGYIFTTDSLQIIDFLPRFLGDISIIIGTSLISLIFVGLPSLKEVDWAKKLNLLLILHKSGSCICDYDFKKWGDENALAKKEYMAGGLLGVSQLVTEMIKNMDQEKFSRMEVMDHQDKQIIFGYGEYLIAALVVDEYLEIYRKKLYHMIREIEMLYGDRLSTSEGKLMQIQPIEKIITQIFS